MFVYVWPYIYLVCMNAYMDMRECMSSEPLMAEATAANAWSWPATSLRLRCVAGSYSSPQLANCWEPACAGTVETKCTILQLGHVIKAQHGHKATRQRGRKEGREEGRKCMGSTLHCRYENNTWEKHCITHVSQAVVTTARAKEVETKRIARGVRLSRSYKGWDREDSTRGEIENMVRGVRSSGWVLTNRFLVGSRRLTRSTRSVTTFFLAYSNGRIRIQHS